MKKSPFAAVALGVLMASSAATSQAQSLVSAADPDWMLEIARGFGRASLETDSVGDPMISGTIEGVRYIVHFYGCSNGRNCDDVIFSAGWSGTNTSIRTVNAWNRDKRFGKAYIDDEGDPMIEMAVNLDYGVSERNLQDTWDWWKNVIVEFQDYIN